MPELMDTNIFRSNSQLLGEIDISSMVPLEDRVVVEDIPDPDKIGSIVIPQGIEIGVGKQGLLRLGRVVAVGPGDKFLEIGFDQRDEVRRRAVTAPSGRLPMDVNVGDTVIWDVRREAEFFVDGKRYSIIHAEQSILAVLD